LGEEYLAETAVYMELNARRKARAAAGQNVVDMDVELARMEPRLRWMERELTEALERLGEGSEAG
jgi:LmbE family N-acetylglucosaminyl deacetylase